MPHAVDDSDFQEQQDDAEIARLLNDSTTGNRLDQNADLFNPDRALDAGEKADDAQDFEDIDDDDLASDEDDTARQAPTHTTTPPTATVTQHEPLSLTEGFAIDEPDHLFDDDLFGDQDVDVESAHRGDGPFTAIKPQTATSLRPLDTNPVIALTGTSSASTADDSRHDQHALQDIYTPLSPAGSAAPSSDTPDLPTNLQGLVDLEEEDPLALMQRRLFARDFDAGPENTMECFYDTWPTFEPDKTPRFTELFPPLPSVYQWKTPLKPPKPLNPSKLVLEIAGDAERSFFQFTLDSTNRILDGSAADHQGKPLIYTAEARDDDEKSTDSLDMDEIDDNTLLAGISWEDIKLACQDFDVASLSNSSSASSPVIPPSAYNDMDFRPAKRRKTAHFDIKEASKLAVAQISLDDPERATARIAEHVTLDMNDPSLLFDESIPNPISKPQRAIGSVQKGVRNNMIKPLIDRYNISNDSAYELLKENHMHKVRSTIGSLAIEHSLPATTLQYPFYQVKLGPKELRSFHRPRFTAARVGKENRFTKARSLKRKHLRGKDAKELFRKTEDLSMGDNSSGLLLEYSEEMPIMLSNFGMGSRVVNYYRRKDNEDSARPKEDIGETQVLLPQDRSPFAIFGHVGPGEIVPTIHNSLYRAPIFKHQGRITDFVLVTNTNAEHGTRYYLRNIENLHTVGQQFPSKEVPGERAKPVVDAAKRRLQALSFRIYKKWILQRGPALTNKLIQEHLPGSDIPANRTKMHEFMQYDKIQSNWVPREGEAVPNSQEMQSWIKPDDLCLIESTQVGLQTLSDLGLRGDDDFIADEDAKEGSNIELLLAPWTATKNFLNACQSKAMLQLHGEGDPTRRGEGFSFIKTSMKGGFRALGESIEERLDAKRLKENNGHSYNVAKQQRAYDESIRRIWHAQKDSLSSTLEHSDNEGELDEEAETDADPGATPSVAGTPAPFHRREDESVSQFSRASGGRKNQTLVVTRTQRDKYGKMQEVPVTITNQRVINAYKRAKYKEQSAKIDLSEIAATGDEEYDAMQLKRAAEEVARLERNIDRAKARARAKGLPEPVMASSPVATDNSDPNTSTPGTVGKQGRKAKATEGTARRCANCGEVGHIRTNKKLCPLLNGTMKPEDAPSGFGSAANAGGASKAQSSATSNAFGGFGPMASDSGSPRVGPGV